MADLAAVDASDLGGENSIEVGNGPAIALALAGKKSEVQRENQ